MKLIKIQDLSSRPVSNVELMTGYLFGNKFPTQFIPGNQYNAGDYVYEIKSNGSVSVYYCNISGNHQIISQPNFTHATIPAMIQKELDAFKESLENNDTSSDVVVNDSIDVDNVPEITVDDSGKINIDSESDVSDETVEVFLDGKKLVINIDYEIVNGEIVLKAPYTEESKVSVNALSTKSVSRLIYMISAEPVTVDTTSGDMIVTVLLDSKLLEKSLVFDIFNNGRYISQNDYQYTYNPNVGGYVITIPKDIVATYKITDDPSHFEVQFTCSYSKEITITKNDISKECVNQFSRFSLDMRYTDFANISKIRNCYADGYLIPAESVVLYNNTAQITNEDHYLQIGQTFTISYKNFVINSIFSGDNEITNNLRESIYVRASHADTKRMPIPFIDYDSDLDSMLVFKGSGYLINSTRYYVDNDTFTMFPHETSLYQDDEIIFHVINTDRSLGTYMKKFNIDADGLNDGVKIVFNGYKPDMSLLVFTHSGMYISKDKYEINDGILTFNGTAPVQVGDWLEIIFFEYTKALTNTQLELFKAKPSSDKVLWLPFAYNGETDNLLIFNQAGMYIDRDRYELSVDGTITLKDTTPFNPDQWVDVFVIRSIHTTPVTDLPEIK